MNKNILKVPLRELVITKKGAKPLILKTKPFEGSVPYLDIQALEGGNVTEHTFKELGNLSNENDVLVVWDGSRSGLVFMGKYGAIGSTIMALTPVGLDTKYLFYFLKANFDYINRNTTGGGIPHVDSTLFFNINIPFINKDEQKTLVSKLEQRLIENEVFLNSHSELVHRALKESKIPYYENENLLTSISNFKQAALLKAFRGELTSDWRNKNNVEFNSEQVLLGSVIDEIKAGKSFRCIERPPNKNEVGVLKVSALSTWEYIENESKTCIDESKINADLFVRQGDFLISRANTKELVGSCAIVYETRGNVMLSDKTLRISFDNTKVLNKYVFFFLQSREGRNQIETFAKGNQESMKNITQSDIKNLKITLPDINEQNEIIDRISDLFHVAESVKRQYEEAVDLSNNLKNSLLEHAFSDIEISRYYNSSISPDDLLEKVRYEKKILQDERKDGNKRISKTKSLMKKAAKELPALAINDVLMESDIPMSAKEVWRASRFRNDIDSFYEALKSEVSEGIRWEITNQDTETPESILSIKSRK